jgi:hypothetical protein
MAWGGPAMTMDSEVLLSSILTAEELFKRWPSENEWTIADLLNKPYGIPAYWLRTSKTNPTTQEPVYFCTPWATPWANKSGNETKFDWRNIVFSTPEIEEYENSYPEVTWPPAPETSPRCDTNGNPGWDEWIPAETVRITLQLSPIKFIEMLNLGTFETNKEEDFLDHYQSGYVDPFYKTVQIPELNIHRSSFVAYQQKHSQPEIFDNEHCNEYSNNLRDEDLLTNELMGLRQRVAQLEAELTSEENALTIEVASLRQRVAELEGELAQSRTEPQRPSRTGAASEAAIAKRLEEWKGHTAQMIKVALACGTQGPKKRKRSELQAIARRHGEELSSVALELLRNSLPDDHVSREPGAAPQG